MKKMFLAVAMMLATFGTINAKNASKKNDQVLNTVKIETLQDVIEQNDSTPYIIKFYDIERLVIPNDSNALIRIYDEKWNLIYETTGSVDKFLLAGTYYVACEKRVKSRIITRN